MFGLTGDNTIYDALLSICGKLVVAILILVLSFVIVKIGQRIIHSVIKRGNKYSKKNITNFEGILKSLFKWIVYIIAVLSILTKVFGILDASSLITTVGVSGLAISIGAQSLISDIISGFFVMVEGQMEVGDYITLGEISGNVVEFELRCVKIENYEGEVVFVPYGEIRKLINKSKTNSSVVVNLPVSYKQNIDEVLQIANEAVSEFEHADLTDKLQVLPSVSLDEKTYSIRIFGKCKACSDWEIEREVSKLLLKKANDKNIKLGFDISND